MLAYRHLFHAGNFADAFKHALLARLLVALGRKEKPYAYIESHAGLGRYDLTHPWAQKNAEFRDGIGRLWEREDAPAALATYLDLVRAENPDGRLRFYPGSPVIAARLARAQDRLVLAELNEDDRAELARVLAHDRRATVLGMDGYQALRANLPPKERRGLVMIDSSFDRAGELARVTEALAGAHARWATGVFALWYPLMAPQAMRGFERGVVATGIRKILQMELSVRPDEWTETLRGTGMLVVNPPFGFAPEAREILAFLAPALAQSGYGADRMRWLVPE
ncbi:MAG: 23S rRNA (adenine(2030)-N(6))-methyltransferase RlmJ [Burkholderiales bacterium]|jgi:23S rRNA (adenine2030-N6)-methyltransferase|nr:23S rRNA (adenine(2030)-N(6))-methyltransferase RlmJ [Burkholderiales bacterium]